MNDMKNATFTKCNIVFFQANVPPDSVQHHKAMILNTFQNDSQMLDDALKHFQQFSVLLDDSVKSSDDFTTL